MAHTLLCSNNAVIEWTLHASFCNSVFEFLRIVQYSFSLLFLLFFFIVFNQFLLVLVAFLFYFY